MHGRCRADCVFNKRFVQISAICVELMVELKDMVNSNDHKLVKIRKVMLEWMICATAAAIQVPVHELEYESYSRPRILPPHAGLVLPWSHSKLTHSSEGITRDW